MMRTVFLVSDPIALPLLGTLEKPATDPAFDALKTAVEKWVKGLRR
jgi:hypothetical protein